MGLFRRKNKAPEIKVVSLGDYIFIKDAIFRVDYNALVQLPVIPVSQNKSEEEQN